MTSAAIIMRIHIQKLIQSHARRGLPKVKRAYALAALMLVGSALGISQPASSTTVFEVASVKRARNPGYPPKMSAPGLRFIATSVNLRLLIGYAYDLVPRQISGGPNWIDSETFDIEARKPNGSTSGLNVRRDPQLMLMVQALLAERFKLKLRPQTKEGAVYALTVAKNGPKPKLTRTNEGSGPTGSGAVITDRDESGPLLVGKNGSMTQLAKILSIRLERPVFDETGLNGTYNFAIHYAPPQTDYNLPSIFTALQEELGLKLEPRRGPVQIFVIEHVEQPSEN